MSQNIDEVGGNKKTPNFKFWGWFQAGNYAVGSMYFLVADGRFWVRLSDRGLYDWMMRLLVVGYLLVWVFGFFYIKKRDGVAAFFISLAVFCFGAALGSLLKQLMLSSHFSN